MDYIGAEYPRGKKARQFFERQGMSEAQIRKLMANDPEAAKFLSDMLPNDENVQNQGDPSIVKNAKN